MAVLKKGTEMKLFLFLLVVLLTNLIQGITGFAGTALAMPFAILLYGIDVAKPSLTILTLLACLMIAIRGYRDIVWREFFKMMGFMFIGVFVGESVYLYLQADVLLRIFAVFIILVALSGLLRKQEYEFSELLLDGIILLAGIIHGMFVSGGPLLIIYAVKKLPEKQNFRATLSMIWVALNLYLVIRQTAAGLMTASTLTITAWSIPALFIGVYLGNRLVEKMSQELFLKLTYLLLLISGASLLF